MRRSRSIGVHPVHRWILPSTPPANADLGLAPIAPSVGHIGNLCLGANSMTRSRTGIHVPSPEHPGARLGKAKGGVLGGQEMDEIRFQKNTVSPNVPSIRRA